MTYEATDDDLAVARGGDSRCRSSGGLGALGSLGLLGDTASRSGSSGSSLNGSSATRDTSATAASSADGLGVLHDLVERLVELSLSRHVVCGDCWVCWKRVAGMRVMSEADAIAS